MYKRIECNTESRVLIPSEPGIYRFINKREEIIYIGASKNLKKRVSYYFNKSNGSNKKIKKIKNLTQYIEYQEYETHESAFEAERIEIWTNHPRLNKRNNRIYSFSYIIIRDIPHNHIICANNYQKLEILPTDRIIRINSHLTDLEEGIDQIRKFLPFCMNDNSRSCWDNQINLCNNECKSKQMLRYENSKKVFSRLHSILSSKENRFTSKLEEKMESFMRSYNFEDAKKVYDVIQSVKSLQRRYGGIGIIHDQSTFNFKEKTGKESLSVEIRLYQKEICVFLKEKKLRTISNISKDTQIIYFIQNYYQKMCYCPDVIILNLKLPKEPITNLKNWMQRYFHRKIEIEDGKI